MADECFHVAYQLVSEAHIRFAIICMFGIDHSGDDRALKALTDLNRHQGLRSEDGVT